MIGRKRRQAAINRAIINIINRHQVFIARWKNNSWSERIRYDSGKGVSASEQRKRLNS